MFASSITSLSTVVTGLTPGVTYKFIVRSRNIIGYSVFANPISVLAAQISDAPTTLSNNV